MTFIPGTRTRGYQGSETSRVRVDLYTFGDDIGRSTSHQGDRTLSFTGETGGRQSPGDASPIAPPQIVSLQVGMAMGGATGTFNISFKSRRGSDFDLMEEVYDSDWVDITLIRHDRTFHTMRGIVDDVRRSTSVVDGATAEVVNVSGRGFGRMFTDTQIYFNPLLELDKWGGAGLQLLARYAAFADQPIPNVVRFALEGWFTQLGSVGRANWEVPRGLSNLGGVARPDIGQRSTVLDFVTIVDQYFSNVPDRGVFTSGTEFSAHDSNVWAFALQFSDEPLVELYTDLLQVPQIGNTAVATSNEFIKYKIPPVYIGTPGGDEVSTDPSDGTTVAAVILRDRPFPSIVRAGLRGRDILQEPWFTEIPLHVVSREEIVDLNVGRSGNERRNSFIVSPQMFQKIARTNVALQVPEWSPNDMRRHGMRRYDISTNYITSKIDLIVTSTAYRGIVRDFHCMNHLFLNGTCQLGHGRPDIRIGSRFRILGDTRQEDETYYTEYVEHSWNYVQGLRTNVGLSRGFKGSDERFVDTLRQVVATYSQSGVSVPTVFGGFLE